MGEEIEFLANERFDARDKVELDDIEALEAPTRHPKPSKENRVSGIGMFPPPRPGTFDLEEPGMFCSDDGKVINWAGENYYRACGEFVSTIEGGSTTCVKPEGHPRHIHEDHDGRTKDEWDLGFGVMSLEEAVGVALGAASSCWSNLDGAGVFQSERASAIVDQLMTRIRQAGPIYD